MPNTFINTVILLCLTVFGAFAATQMANYPLMNTIQSGDHKLLTASRVGPSTLTYEQSFKAAFGNLPTLAISIRDLQVSGATTNSSTTSNSINYMCSIGSITTSRFITTLTLTSPITFGLLYYFYIGLNLNLVGNTYLYPYSIDTSSFFNDTRGVANLTPYTITQTISDFTKAVVTPLPRSFSVSTSYQYSFFLSAGMISNNQFQLNITSNSNLQRIELTVFIIDKTAMEATYTYFIDSGGYKIYQNSTTPISTFTPPSFNYFNHITGLTSMQVNSSFNPNFAMTPSNTFITTTQYIFLEYKVLHWRFRQCISPSTIGKFVLQEQLCYDVCPTGYATNTSINYCVLCDYTCASCQVDGTSCLSCPTLSFRTLNNSTNRCDCDTGYFHNFTVVCAACDYTCFTCSVTKSNCTSCDPTRNLTTNTCPCSTGYYDVGNNTQTCSTCHYSCYTCNGGSAYSCLSCNSASTSRVFIPSTNQCLCQSGRQDSGVAICTVSSVICASPCLTCSGTGSSCTSCSTTTNSGDRVLSGSACVCPSEYTATNSTAPCTIICGNGLMPSGTAKQCDDGNTLQGDGCSSLCTVEAGFSCGTSQPSICTSNSGYIITRQTLTKDSGSNILTAVIRISPVPPASTVPSLSNLQDSLSLSSYSLNRDTLTLRLNLLKEVKSDQILSVRMALINTSTGVPMLDSNNVQLIPYDSTYYNIYDAQQGLIWAYIAILWTAAIYRLLTDPKMISQVTEVFFYSSLVWIGAAGQKIYTAPLVPLLNLKYIFGYNLTIEGNNSLFSVFNIGFVYIFFPLLLYLAFIIVGKKCAGSVTGRTKRFILYDLTFSWLMINGYLAAYGASLAITSQTSLSGITAAGLAVACIYLIVMVIVCYRSFFRGSAIEDINPVLSYFKKNLFKPKLYAVLWLCSIAISFIYLSIKNMTKVNPLLMMGYFLLLFVIVGVAGIYINKIRVILNLISLILIYGCILLINNVTTASWTGLVIVGFLYIQLITNFAVMHFERNNMRIDEDDAQKAKAQAKGQIKIQPHPQPNDAIDNPNLDTSARDNALAGHTGLFTIYEPQSKEKKELELIIPYPSPKDYESNAIEAVLRSNDKPSDRQRMMEMKMSLNEFLLTSPKHKKMYETQREQEDFIDLDQREVEMHQF